MVPLARGQHRQRGPATRLVHPGGGRLSRRERRDSAGGSDTPTGSGSGPGTSPSSTTGSTPLHLRYDGQQRLRVGVLRRREHLLGGPGLDDPAEVHHRRPVGDVPRQAEVVGHHEHAEPELGAQLEQQREDLAPDGGVEARDRLVGDDQLGPQRQGTGDQHPLALPAGQLVRVAQEQLLGRPEPGRRERVGHLALLGPAVGVVGGELVQPDSLGDGLVDRVPRVEGAGRVLEDHLHPAPERAQVAGPVAQRRPVEEHLAAGGALEPGQRPGQGRLPRARLPHQRQDLAGPHGQVGAVERGRDHARPAR